MAEQILVIFLSTALAIFLVLGIVLVSICIKIAKSIKRLTEKAEQITDKAESLAEFVQQATTPLAIGKLIAHTMETIFHRKDRQEK